MATYEKILTSAVPINAVPINAVPDREITNDADSFGGDHVPFGGDAVGMEPDGLEPDGLEPAGMEPEPFGGDKKDGESILGPYEKSFVQRWVTKVPRSIETYHLTMLTVAWSIGMVAFGWLAASDPRWLFAMSAMVIGQYATDLFDGAVGRLRDTGLVKWGFFMDHFLDFIFAGSFVVAYSFLAPNLAVWFLGLLLATGATMALSFLNFAATNKFKIAFFGVGPTEVRIGYVALNTFVFFAGTQVLTWGVPVMLGASAIGLAVMAFDTHRSLWAIDMAAKQAQTVG